MPGFRPFFIAVSLLASSLCSDFADAHQFKVLTFNTWLLPGISADHWWNEPFVESDYNGRLPGIIDALGRSGADIIALQEVWRPDARRQIIRGMQLVGYSEVARFDTFSRDWGAPLRGCLGNGLLILSKFQIVGPVTFLPFTDYTRPDEWLARKGVLSVRLRVPNLGEIDVHTAHLGAVTFERPHGYDSGETWVQSLQLAELRRYLAQRPIAANGFVLALDSNFSSGTWNSESCSYIPGSGSEYRGILQHRCIPHLVLRDSYADTHPADSDQGLTLNHSNPNILNGRFASDPSERADYIFYLATDSRFHASQSEVTLNRNFNTYDLEHGRTPVRSLPLSDHYGVMTTFTIDAAGATR